MHLESYSNYGRTITIDNRRDARLTDFGKATLQNRYLLNEINETYQQLFARVACKYSVDNAHAQRNYDNFSRHWVMPATPILSNGGTIRGLPISCFLNECVDSLKGIAGLWDENIWLASKGGGIGSYWGNLRSIGEANKNGKTSGVIPFIRVMDSLTLAISQGSLRRGSAAVYLPVWHPEIEEFIDLRKPLGGDPNRKALNLHHGILVPDEFMFAVQYDLPWDLKSPKDGSVIRTISARNLWMKILTTRVEQGEPYIVYSDTVNNSRPEHHKILDLEVKTSNLCAEITLPTGIDYKGKDRTAVCCLTSFNLEYWDEYKDNYQVFYDTMLFLDLVLQDFIENAPPEMAKAVYSAIMERSVGAGVMGWHSLLQSKNIPFDSFEADDLNEEIFERIQTCIDTANTSLGITYGSCPDAIEAGLDQPRRFSNTTAIAPTASISIIAGNSSPGIEPWNANVFLQKTLSGSFTVKNRHLDKLLTQYGQNTDEVWASITSNKGSVEHLDFLTERERDVFKTAFELDQSAIVRQAAARAPFISQAQSVNLFLPANVDKKILHDLHMQAWDEGLKSLYYCRSLSLQKADSVSERIKPVGVAADNIEPKTNPNNGDECLACQ